MKRCFYDDSISGFLNRTHEEILGILAKDNTFDLSLEQRSAWIEEISIMKSVLLELNKSGHIIFE